MNSLMTKEELKHKILEGFVVGVMVSLTIAVCGMVWNAFSTATTRLSSAEELLRGQSRKLELQSSFNGDLIEKLEEQQGLTITQLEDLAADIERTRLELESKLSTLATAINQLPKEQGDTSAPTLASDFGKLQSDPQILPPKPNLPDFKGFARGFEDIVKPVDNNR